MSAEIEVHQPSTVEKIEWARAMAPAGLLPKAYQGNPANLLLAAEYADALGIERINAITSIHVIEGKPTVSSDLMAALVRRAGHRLRVSIGNGTVTATLIRSDDPEFPYEASWTMERATRAGLAGKDVWKKYPQAMLRSRAISEVVRMGASEVLVGAIYTAEELGAEVDRTGAPVMVTVHSEPVTAAEILEATIDDAPPADDPLDYSGDLLDEGGEPR